MQRHDILRVQADGQPDTANMATRFCEIEDNIFELFFSFLFIAEVRCAPPLGTSLVSAFV